MVLTLTTCLSDSNLLTFTDNFKPMATLALQTVTQVGYGFDNGLVYYF